MLNDKDYCDYETSCKLSEIGFSLDMTEKVYERNLYTNRYEQIPKPLLYEAQKFLREEKGFDFEITILNKYRHYNAEIRWNTHWMILDKYVPNGLIHTETYEEALNICINVAIQILKENEHD